MLCVEVKEKKICDWRGKYVIGSWEIDFSCCGCYYGLCHDRCACMAGQKNLIKVFIFLFSGGDGTGIILLLFFITPALPLLVSGVFLPSFFCLVFLFFSPTLTLAVLVRYQIFNDSQSRCLRAKKGKQKVQSIETHQFYIHGTLIS